MALQPDPFATRSPGRHMLIGSLWMIAMRWSIRGIGLISTLVLVRLLSPTDFGLMAMAVFTLGLVAVLSDTGQRTAVIRHPAPTRAHYDTAWTLSVLAGILIAAVLFAGAPLASAAFDEPEAAPLIRILALCPLIGGFENIGTLNFRRELTFGKDFRFGVYRKLLGFGVTLPLAILLQSYWALAAGMVVGTLGGVVLSYTMHPYRPRWSLSKLGDIWSFSLWLLAVHLGDFVLGRVDRAVVGRLGGTTAMGYYTVASEVAIPVTGELALPLARAAMPVYARLTDRPDELRRSFLDVFTVLGYFCLSTSVGLALVAADAVPILLGATWTPSVPLFAWLGIAFAMQLLANSGHTLMVSLGRGRLSAILMWIRVALTVPALVLGGFWYGTEGVATASAVAAATLLPLPLVAAARVVGLPVVRVGAALLRPVAATAIMAAAVLTLHPDGLPFAPLRLIWDIVVGVSSFGAAAIVIWWVAGAPAGPERALLDGLASRLATPGARARLFRGAGR